MTTTNFFLQWLQSYSDKYIHLVASVKCGYGKPSNGLNVCFALDQRAQCDFIELARCSISLQIDTSLHPDTFIILTPSQPIFALTPYRAVSLVEK